MFGGCHGDHSEHPEHPEEGVEAHGVTKDELADAIVDYVADESRSGYYQVYDEINNEMLKLTLDKVHRKRLSQVGKDEYFACADFTTPTGKVYDLDVFMTGTNKENLTFSKFMVHKEAGKERYTWYQQGGVWKRKGVGQAIAEHPK